MRRVDTGVKLGTPIFEWRKEKRNVQTLLLVMSDSGSQSLIVGRVWPSGLAWRGECALHDEGRGEYTAQTLRQAKLGVERSALRAVQSIRLDAVWDLGNALQWNTRGRG